MSAMHGNRASRPPSPTLVVHGDDDQIVPIGTSAMLSAKLLQKAELKGVSRRATWPRTEASGRAEP